MNDVDTITVADMRRFRKGILTGLLAVLLANAATVAARPQWWSMALGSVAVLGIALVVGLVVVHLAGTLTSIQLSGDGLTFTYGHVLSSRTERRRFEIGGIREISYSKFLNRLTVRSATETLHVTVRDSKGTPVQALVEAVNRRRGVGG